MKSVLGVAFLSACLAFSVSAADSASANVKVQASSDLRVAVLDLSPTPGDHSVMHEAFATSLGATMSRQCGGTVNVKVTEVDAIRLGFDLKAGIYDAAFVIGNNVPAVLRKSDFEIIRGIADVGVPGRVFHMIIPSDDPQLQKMISLSFPEALASSKFQEAVTRAVAIKINPDAIRKATKENVADTAR
jgi:hypothetical protein